MQIPITALDIKFNSEAIRASLPDLPDLQIAVTHSKESSAWTDGCGSLWDYEKKAFTRKTSDYLILNSHFAGSYVEKVVEGVREVATGDGVKIGRIRIMRLNAKTCYTLHRDIEEFRYHIPLVTYHGCFFVHGETISRMPEVGRLYRFRTSEFHTAVNATFFDRSHMVFDTYL